MPRAPVQTRSCTGAGAGSIARPGGPDLDGAVVAEREPLGPLDGFVHRVALDHVEAAQSLLRLGKGAVGDLDPAGLDANAAGLFVRAQALRVDHLAGGRELGLEALMTLEDLLHLRGLPRRRRPVYGDEQHVAHRFLLTPYDADEPRKSTSFRRLELVEVIIHATFYSGWPTGVQGAAIAKRVLESRGL